MSPAKSKPLSDHIRQALARDPRPHLHIANEIGVSTSTLTRFRDSQTAPSSDLLEKLAVIYPEAAREWAESLVPYDR